jgi:hypothetical protein
MSLLTYTPILKGKRGEYDALATMPLESCARLYPVVEVMPIPWDWQRDVPARTLDAHLARDVGSIMECWGCDQPVMVDLKHTCGPKTRTGSGVHPVEWMHSQLRIYGVLGVPVTTLNRDDHYQEAVGAAAHADALGAALRLAPSDFNDAVELEASMFALLATLGLECEEVDIILDIGAISQDVGRNTALIGRVLIETLPTANGWRSLTLASSSFPADLSQIRPRSVGHITRAEWQTWSTLLDQLGTLTRMPNFGDYGIDGPALTLLDPRVMRMSANIRYTSETDWYIGKGGSVDKDGFEQYRKLADDLMHAPEWCGPHFSSGDSYIAECAAYETPGPGNATTWRRVGTSHHLAFVLDQLSKILAT